NRIATVRRKVVGVKSLDFAQGHPLPVTIVQLPEAPVTTDLQTQAGGDRSGGLPATQQIAAIDRADSGILTQRFRQTTRLSQTPLTERNGRVALIAPQPIPVRMSVPDQCQPCLHPGVPYVT